MTDKRKKSLNDVIKSKKLEYKYI